MGCKRDQTGWIKEGHKKMEAVDQIEIEWGLEYSNGNEQDFILSNELSILKASNSPSTNPTLTQTTALTPDLALLLPYENPEAHLQKTENQTLFQTPFETVKISL